MKIFKLELHRSEDSQMWNNNGDKLKWKREQASKSM